MIKMHNKVRMLNLTLDDFVENNIGYEGAKALAEALKTNTTLTELNLSYKKIY